MTTVLNYTTKIAASKSLAEMQTMLVKHGATRIAVDYADDAATGLTFSLPTPHGVRLFSLPVDVDAMQRLLSTMKPTSGSIAAFRSRKHAEQVAWRVMKDWLAAQLALIQTQMATLDQVMLPYLHVDAERTLYAAYVEREEALALEEGS
jgi:hypothetical protein